MTPPPTCGSPAVAPKLTLVEALNRMEREARTGLLDTGRYRCRFLEWGEGPPLVFIHGLGDVPRSFALVMAQLSRHFRCIAYHQPTGSGDLARLRRYRHQHLLDDFFRLADHLRLEGGAVVGHSFGTTIALKALHDQPERFRRGVLACGFAHRPLTRSHWWLGAMARLFPVGPRLVHWRARNEAMRRLHYRGFEHVEPDRWQFFLDQTGQTPIVTMGHWGHVLHHLDLRPLVPRIRQPLLLVCGDDDRLVPHQVQMQLFDQLPNAVMFQITGCGHMPTLTHPEAFAQAVLTFSGQGDLGTPIGHGLHGCGGSGPDERGLCPASAQPCASHVLRDQASPACPPVDVSAAGSLEPATIG